MLGGPTHKLELEISLDKGQKQHAQISSPGKFPSVPSPHSFSSICKGMGRNWSKQLKSCCNLGFYENQSEVDIQGWYSISPMMCDIPRGKQQILELAKQDPEDERVGSCDGGSVQLMEVHRISNSVIWYSLPELARKFELFCMNITKKKKWKQLI